MRWSWFLVPVALSYACTAAVLATAAPPMALASLWAGPLLAVLCLTTIELLPRLFMLDDAIPSAPKRLWLLVATAAIGLAAGNVITGRPLLAWRTDLGAVGTRELVVWASLAVAAFGVLARSARRTISEAVDDATESGSESFDAWPDRRAPEPVADVDVRRVDTDDPAVWTVDDGRDATVYVTDGARTVLDANEQRAVVARESAATVDGTPAVAFWTTGLASVLERLLPTDSRSPSPILLLFLIYLFSLFRPLAGTNRALQRVHDRRTATHCDEAGAIIVDDARGLATALEKLSDAETDSTASLRGVLGPLTPVPNANADLETRRDALAAVQDRLDDRTTRDPADAPVNASS